MRVSLRDLAKQAGVSVATVSRALRDMSTVAPDTHDRIHRLARKHGYVRDPMLSNALAFARRNEKPIYRETIAVIGPVPEAEIATLPWLRLIFEGVKGRAHELGYATCYHRLPSGEIAQKTLGRRLWLQGIHGCVLFPIGPEMEALPLTVNFDWQKMIGIQLGQAIVRDPIPSISHNLLNPVQVMCSKLHEKGYRHIGLAVNRVGEESRHWEVMAALLVFREFHPDMKISVLFRDEECYTAAAFYRWLKRRKPDVLVINGGGVMEWLKARSFRIPEDIGICRIDCMPDSRESGLLTNYIYLGFLCANQLITTLEHRSVTGPSPSDMRFFVQVSGMWHEGKTLCRK